MLATKMKVIELESPWTKFRRLLLSIKKYLDKEETVREDFKMFFDKSIPTPCWDGSTSCWMRKMEQMEVIKINKLNGLFKFFQARGDTSEILSEIREFRQWMRTMRVLMANLFPDHCLRSGQIETFNVELSQELEDLFHLWQQRISDADSLTWSIVHELNSQATQRMTLMARSSTHSAAKTSHLLLLEALAIADFLMQELSTWFLKHNEFELDMAFGCEITKLLRSES